MACAVGNSTTGKISAVDDWLCSKAIHAQWGNSHCKPKFTRWGLSRGYLPRQNKISSLVTTSLGCNAAFYQVLLN